MRFSTLLVTFLLIGLFQGGDYAAANEKIQLPQDPDLNQDGSRLVFSWRGDIWTSRSTGGVARQLTTSTSSETQPKFSKDGKRISFISNRTGADQVFEMPVNGGAAVQMTFHTEGYTLEEYVGNDRYLVKANRDHFWRKAQRFFLTNRKPRSPETLVFDGYGDHGRVSPDGSTILFSREGVRGYRKGYVGTQAGQIWLYDLKKSTFKKLVAPAEGAKYPLWHPNGKDFFYSGQQGGSFNLYRRNLDSGKETALTQFKDDAVITPAISGDGKVLVFRRLFDFYRLDLIDGSVEPLKLVYRGEQKTDPVSKVTLSDATDVSFSADGSEIAFIAGGDVWVMDTILKEPKQITSTAEEERDVVFAKDKSAILFASDKEGQSDIWSATRSDEKKFWWENSEFTLKRLTKDGDKEYGLSQSPDGKTLAFLKARGDLWLMDMDGKNNRRFLKSWNSPSFDWAPNSKWITYAISDNNFNRDVWVKKIDSDDPAINISQHPDNESNPRWSPDGNMIAFYGRRLGQESDVYFVYLNKENDETDARDRRYKEALEKAKKSNNAGTPGKTPSSKPAPKKGRLQKELQAIDGRLPSRPLAGGTQTRQETQEQDDAKKSDKPAAEKKEIEIKIDVDGLSDRVRRVSVPNTTESNLFWSSDSKQLAFSATINGKAGTYTVSPPDGLQPKLLTTSTVNRPRWNGATIYGLVSSKPASLNAAGATTSYGFSAKQKVNRNKKFKAAFDMCWREMRDNFYDPALNNRNWSEVRRKYAAAAEAAVDERAFGEVVNMMLGELNGSHLGFFGGRRSSQSSSSTGQWRETTAHFGLRFDPSHKGPGLKVKDVIHESPASLEKSKISVGEVVLEIEGKPVDPAMELTSVLNGDIDSFYHLKVKDKKGDVRDVRIKPVSYGAARGLLYNHWIRQNQAAVDKASQGKLAYMHIQGMNMSSFYRFERELYSIANGKEGLIIDVRENGGGSTTDHLLTILTQPVHALTVPRGGGVGYPHDRKVYATWNKPIVVLCNQNSFSNAEIFSHAIRTLKRGQVVGVQTAGGVISTGGTSIMDIGFLRKPFRGWYLLNDGKDMELNGAMPHHVVWPHPGDLPKGKDDQLRKAISVLKKDVAKWKSNPLPKPENASQLRK